jgi:hypothetical protein
MSARRRMLALLVTVCALNACESPRPSPQGDPVEAPEACKAIIERGGQC